MSESPITPKRIPLATEVAGEPVCTQPPGTPWDKRRDGRMPSHRTGPGCRKMSNAMEGTGNSSGVNRTPRSLGTHLNGLPDQWMESSVSE